MGNTCPKIWRFTELQLLWTPNPVLDGGTFSNLLPCILPCSNAYVFWALQPNLAYEYLHIRQISHSNITNLLYVDEPQLSH